MQRKILIIEDESFIAEMYRVEFQNTGYHVDVAGDGLVGLKQAKRCSPDVILLDLILPKKNGYDVLSELKKHDKTKSIPVVIASNLVQDEEIQQGLNLGAVDYVIKTAMTPRSLVQKVDKVFQR